MDYQVKAAEEAYRAAANVVKIFDAKASGKNWPGCDYVGEKIAAEQIAEMAAFVRQNPTAPGESLYRFANGRGFHTGDPGGWLDLPPQFIAAYETFQQSLLTFDRLFTQLVERIKKEMDAVSDGPVLAAALALPEEDRLDALLPDPLSMNPNVVLTVIDPFVPFEGEFGGPVPDVPAIPMAQLSPDAADPDALVVGPPPSDAAEAVLPVVPPSA